MKIDRSDRQPSPANALLTVETKTPTLGQASVPVHAIPNESGYLIERIAPGRPLSEPNGKSLRWVNYVDRRLSEFASLPEHPNDPESYPRPFDEALARARRVAWTHFRAETPTPSVVPTRDRGVDFVWYKGGWHLELSVEQEGDLVWAHNLSTGELWEGSLDERSGDLRLLLDGLSGVE